MKLSRIKFLAVAVLFALLVKPVYFTYCLPIADRIYDVLAIISLLFIFGCYGMQAFKKRQWPAFHPGILALALFEGWLVLVTFINWFIGTSGIDMELILYIGRYGVYVLAMAVLCELFQDDIKTLLSGLMLALEVLIYTNLITMLLFPKGMYATELQALNWILGYKNQHIVYLLPAVLLALLYFPFEKKHFRSIALLCACGISTVLGRSSTTIVGFGILTVCLLLGTWKKGKLFHMVSYLCVVVAGFFGIIIFRMQNLFAFFIVDVLHKDLTFTNRVGIWDFAIERIRANWLLGYGVRLSAVRGAEMGNPEAVTAHDQYLELLYIGGIGLLVLFLLLVGVCTWKLMQHRAQWSSRVLSAGLFALLFMMLTDVYDQPLSYFIFVLAWQADRFFAPSTQHSLFTPKKKASGNAHKKIRS